MTRTRFAFALLAPLTLAVPTLAGPDWIENTDAGRLTTDAQVTTGVGALNSISGTLTGIGPAGDFEDVYAIQITDGQKFSAQTFLDGNTTFNTQLWLFDAAGLGLLGNQQRPDPVIPGSLLQLPTTDGTSVELLPGLYFLAITGLDNRPVSEEQGGVPLDIFEFVKPGEISGPDGPGAGFPLMDWQPGVGEIGAYEIVLTGAAFAQVPAPSTLVILIGLPMFARRRRR